MKKISYALLLVSLLSTFPGAQNARAEEDILVEAGKGCAIAAATTVVITGTMALATRGRVAPTPGETAVGATIVCGATGGFVAAMKGVASAATPTEQELQNEAPASDSQE